MRIKFLRSMIIVGFLCVLIADTKSDMLAVDPPIGPLSPAVQDVVELTREHQSANYYTYDILIDPDQLNSPVVAYDKPIGPLSSEFLV